MKTGKYSRRASGCFVYLFLAGAYHNIIADLLHAQPVSFITAQKFAAGVSSRSSGLGDFDQDGNTDLAVANAGSNNVSVLFGNGNGTFQAAVNFPVGGSPNLIDPIVVAYLNGDSFKDLAVANTNGNVSVLLGNGNGTFRAALDFFAGGSADFIDYGDFNGDHLQDLIVSTPGFITVLPGNGDGTFRAPLNTPGSLRVTGYFNDDGILDVASFSGVQQRVLVKLGNGDGTFQTPIPSTGVIGPSSLEV